MFMPFAHLPVILLLLLLSLATVYLKKLTPAGGLSGFVCALLIYEGAGTVGLLLLAAFFIAGTLATAWGGQKKVALTGTGDKGARTAGQVFANGGVAALMALGMLLYPSGSTTLLLMLAASLSSATADTLSSELGMVYGRRFYNCITWKKEQAGLDGVISLEGTLIGVCGAVLTGLLFSCFTPFSNAFLIIVLSGAAGNFLDSLMGARLERQNRLNNDQVNFLSTLSAAAIAFFLHLIFNWF